MGFGHEDYFAEISLRAFFVGVAKLQPRENRADKKGKGAGDGSI